MTDALRQFLRNDNQATNVVSDVECLPLFIAFIVPGSIRAFAYSHLYSIALMETLEIVFTDDLVVVEGNELEPLLWAIQQQLVGKVRQVDELHAQANGQDSFVSSIEIQSIGEAKP